MQIVKCTTQFVQNVVQIARSPLSRVLRKKAEGLCSAKNASRNKEANSRNIKERPSNRAFFLIRKTPSPINGKSLQSLCSLTSSSARSALPSTRRCPEPERATLAMSARSTPAIKGAVPCTRASQSERVVHGPIV